MKEIERFRRRDLPHWDMPGATYFVTTCLEGSIPARGLLDILRYKKELETRRPKDMSDDDWRVRCWKLTFARIDEWLDHAPASRFLSDQRLAEEVLSDILHFAGERYDVLSFVVMPSHFHWAFRPIEGWVESLVGEQTPRERIMQGLKGFAAKQCNKILKTSGQFWQVESYDHWVRSADELERIIHYIEQNPVKAHLATCAEKFHFSSARLRKELGLEFGMPLPRGGRPPGLQVS